MAADLRRAGRKYGVTFPQTAIRAARLARERGFRLREALEEGLLDPQISEAMLEPCIGRERLNRIQERLNPPERACLVRDKAVFYAYCRAARVPVPELFAVFGRLAGFTGSGRALRGREEWDAFFADGLPAEFVLKPSLGIYGLGVRVVRRERNSFIDNTGVRFTRTEFYHALTNDPTYPKFILQDRLEPHPELVRLSGTSALQTVRMVTYVAPDGSVQVGHTFLRVIVGQNIVDNYRKGKTGNLACPVGPSDGRLKPALGASRDGVGLATHETHPATGVRFEGFGLPDWTAARALVARAAVLFLPMRCLGWDVGLTGRGPVLVEGNMWWEPRNLMAGFDSDGERDAGARPPLFEELAAEARRGRVDWRS